MMQNKNSFPGTLRLSFIILLLCMAVYLSVNETALATCTYIGSPPGAPPPPPPTIPCCEHCSDNCKGSPVFAKSGNYSITATDVQIPTRGLALSIERTYDSSRLVDGFFGYSWSSNITPRLSYSTSSSNPPTHDATIVMPNGVPYPFRENQDGTFTPPLGSHQTLIRNGDGSYDLTPSLTRSRWHFSPTGSLTSMTDDYGNSLIFTYDGNGRLIQISDSTGSGRYLTVSYGPSGRISSIQDSSGRVVQYAYTAQGALQTVTDAAGHQTRYSYTIGRFSIPFLTQIQDHWNRVVSTISYYNYSDAGANNSNRLRSYTESGETYTYNYVNGSHTDKTDSSGAKWGFDYNSAGQITTRTPPANNGGSAISTVYNADGTVNSTTDEVGVRTSYTYNPNSSIATVTRDFQGSLAVRFDYTYDPNFAEKVISIIPKNPSTNAVDPNWQAWKYDYYQAGSAAPGSLLHVYRVQSDGVTLDTLSTYTYNSAGQVLTVADLSGGVTSYAYDPTTGDLTSVTYPKNSDSGANPVYQYGRDAVGRVSSVTDPLGHVTSYTYDAVDRITSVTLPKPTSGSPLNFVTSYSYDNYDAATGLVFTNQTDPNNNLTKQGFDSFGQLVKSIDALNKSTSFIYTKGLLTSITDANNNVTSYAYNGLHRLTTTSFPNSATEAYTYTADGLLATKRDRKNQTITYNYDRLKRLISKVYPNSASITYAYLGQKLMSVTDGLSSETHSFSYDPSYRIASNTEGARGTISYTYDPTDHVGSYAIQNGPTGSYAYFDDGSLKSIQWSPTTGQFDFGYTISGQYGTITFPNGQHRDYTYDDQGRLTQIANLHPVTGDLGTFGYGYDNPLLGQRTSMTSNLGSTNYSYDSNYQLTQANYPNAAPFSGEIDSWNYDNIGNRLSSTVNSTTANYTYFKNGANPLNGQRLQSDGSKTYTYDANGNITGDGTYAYTWDYENRLTGITGGGLTASYSYDYLGRRKSKTVNSVTTTYLYDGQNLIREVSAGTTDYVFGPGIDEPLASSNASQINYYTADGLGSIAALNDTTGAIQNSYVYDSWGIVKSQTGTTANPFTYTARETAEAGLMFYRARYYSPGIGRFISEDIAHDFVSRYAYAANNPLRFIDPTGREATGIGPDDPPPGCVWTGPWSEFTLKYPLRRCSVWKLDHEVGASGPGVGEGGTEEGASPLPTCKCIYKPAGLKQLWEIISGFKRPYQCPYCPPTNGFKYKWGPFREEWEPVESIYDPNLTKEVDKPEGGEGCFCEEEICG